MTFGELRASVSQHPTEALMYSLGIPVVVLTMDQLDHTIDTRAPRKKVYSDLIYI